MVFTRCDGELSHHGTAHNMSTETRDREAVAARCHGRSGTHNAVTARRRRCVPRQAGTQNVFSERSLARRSYAPARSLRDSYRQYAVASLS